MSQGPAAPDPGWRAARGRLRSTGSILTCFALSPCEHRQPWRDGGKADRLLEKESTAASRRVSDSRLGWYCPGLGQQDEAARLGAYERATECGMIACKMTEGCLALDGSTLGLLERAEPRAPILRGSVGGRGGGPCAGGTWCLGRGIWQPGLDAWLGGEEAGEQRAESSDRRWGDESTVERKEVPEPEPSSVASTARRKPSTVPSLPLPGSALHVGTYLPQVRPTKRWITSGANGGRRLPNQTPKLHLEIPHLPHAVGDHHRSRRRQLIPQRIADG
ncbi:hypothetical protein ACCO45_007959 [Purpureocillium lilacinum]|uniref:Uncharacterized protein n=1 Tax=Purpureocillium lilacinum TaxID=33203 RepID=A0ACC4DMA9_PURLI